MNNVLAVAVAVDSDECVGIKHGRDAIEQRQSGLLIGWRMLGGDEVGIQYVGDLLLRDDTW